MTELIIKEFDIERREDGNIGKFIVSLGDNNTFEVYAAQLLHHAYIAEAFSIPEERVLGGGYYTYSGKGDLLVWGSSSDFGAVPTEVMDRTAQGLCDFLKQRNFVVNKYDVKNSGEEIEGRNARRWRELGFKIDTYIPFILNNTK